MVTSNSICLQLWYNVAASMLGYLTLTKTSINGLLNRGGMFLFSAEHVNRLVVPHLAIDRRGTLLDLGAGNGDITSYLAAHFTHTLATEASAPMRWRLSRRPKFSVVDVQDWPNLDNVDAISALNLIDRIGQPMTLLRQLHTLASRCDCPVILAVVFPFSQVGLHTLLTLTQLTCSTPNSTASTSR